MYICYDNLWKLLAQRKMSKTDLCSLTGLSSRTIFKLVKNQTVTTDTLIAVCKALNCSLGDIMELREGDALKVFYDAFKSEAKLISKTALISTYSLTHMGIEYIIKITNKRATKRSVIHCEGNTVMWEQLYPSAIFPVSERFPVCKVGFTEKNQRGVLVIQGVPAIITGLDDGVFVSSKGPLKSDDDIFVMSYNAFKTFTGEKR